MRTLTFDDIDKEGLLCISIKEVLQPKVRLLRVNLILTRVLFILHLLTNFFGLGFDYQDEVSDEKHDNVAWEFNKFMRLLLKSNPTVLEALFVDDENLQYYEHPIITELKKRRDKFVTKACFNSFGLMPSHKLKRLVHLERNV